MTEEWLKARASFDLILVIVHVDLCVFHVQASFSMLGVNMIFFYWL